MIDDFENVGGSMAVPPPVPQTETGDIIVHQEPRITANKLAEYVIAEPARQMVIIKDCKFAKKAVILPYKKTRTAVKRAFTRQNLDINGLVASAKEIERENEQQGLSDWQRSDNTNSANAIMKVVSIVSELSWKDARVLPAQLGGMIFAGVKVSVYPEIIFSFEHRNVSKIGAVILNTAKADDKSLARNNGGACVGNYLSSMLFQMLLSSASRLGPPLNSKCYAVDIFREKVYTAPASYRKLNKNLEAACKVIAAVWPTIEFD